MAALVAMAVLVTACGDAETAPPGTEHDADVVAILAAADARPVSDSSLAPVLEALTSPIATVRIQAVRALGRLERPGLIPSIRPLMDDPDAVVRAEAANALAQAVQRGDSVGVARAILLAALDRETEPDALGIIGQSLGRLRAADAAAIDTVARELAGHADSAAVLGRIGLAKAFYRLARQPAARGALPASAIGALRTLFEAAGDTTLLDRRVRTLAAGALVAARVATMDDYRTILADPDPFVRREAVAGLGSAPDAAAARGLVDETLRDTSPVVRYEALRVFGAQNRVAGDCAPVDRATADPDAHVALLAIDLLAACEVTPARVATVDTMTASLPREPVGEWHRAAHALVSLAALDASAAASRLPAFAEHANPFVRTYAAHAATAIPDARTLRTLVDDSIPNVRLAALRGLAAAAPDSARAAALRLLDGAEGELAMVAAQTLEGARDTTAHTRLLDALERLTAMRRETSRDPRMALLERIDELGSAPDSARLGPLARDFDPVVADRAAAILSRWTGSTVRAEPRPLPPQPFPTAERLRALERDTVEITLANGRTILIRLLPWDAPTNADRFARLAGDRFFDGLTIHRVVPNFVIQGGSPAANEYVGDGPYSRDEVSIDGNWRGTVGLSTRGRDTGDGQFYVNLVDNIRLDHDYTVFGQVVSGMDVVDDVLEGERIRAMRIRGG